MFFESFIVRSTSFDVVSNSFSLMGYDHYFSCMIFLFIVSLYNVCLHIFIIEMKIFIMSHLCKNFLSFFFLVVSQYMGSF